MSSHNTGLNDKLTWVCTNEDSKFDSQISHEGSAQLQIFILSNLGQNVIVFPVLWTDVSTYRYVTCDEEDRPHRESAGLLACFRGLEQHYLEPDVQSGPIVLCVLFNRSFIFLLQHLSNIIYNTSISGVRSSWTSLYILHQIRDTTIQ